MSSQIFAGKQHSGVPTNPWKTKSSREIYKNAWIRVREDHVVRPDGGPGIYGVIEIRPSVGVVAIDRQDRVVLVGQWRYSLDRFSWEIPRGGSHPGETDMLGVAQRELAEETGVIAQHWQKLGAVDICNGVANDVQTLFLATGLSETEMNLDPEEDITVKWLPFEEAVGMAMAGHITEVCSVAALFQVALWRKSRA
ncbi:MAG: NUDIX hydrolase [Acidobacteriaceae bacterium]|nr:NUDIX hydrolase [Acidobacteriaceae bacterium]MBV9675328.1 NUDIX hydrolase [Acidobacteriaceae bacterium]